MLDTVELRNHQYYSSRASEIFYVEVTYISRTVCDTNNSCKDHMVSNQPYGKFEWGRITAFKACQNEQKPEIRMIRGN